MQPQFNIAAGPSATRSLTPSPSGRRPQACQQGAGGGGASYTGLWVKSVDDAPLGHEPITHAWLGEQVHRMTWIRLHLAPELIGINAQVVRLPAV